MTDVEEIQALLYTYCQGYDAGDVAVVGALWAEDAVMVTGRGEQPVEALRQFSQTAAGWKGKGRHLIHNPLVRVDGDRATFSATWVVVGLPEAGPALAGVGTYRGEARRTQAGWKISRWSPEAIVMKRELLGKS